METVQAIGGAAVQQPTTLQDKTWVHQPVPNGTVERFRVLLNGVTNTSEVAPPEMRSHTSSAVTTQKSAWDDVFNRETLLQEINKMNGVPLVEQPAATAKLMMMSFDLGLKTQSVRDASKNMEGSVKDLLHG